MGFRLVELGNFLLSQLDLRKEAGLSLRDLAERTKEMIYLVLLDQNEVVYIDKVETDQNPSGLRMASHSGLRNPAHSCAVGKVLLAHLPEEAVDHFLQENALLKRTENTRSDPSSLKKHLKAVRTQGYAIDDEENILKLLRVNLIREDFDVITFSDGLEALKKLEKSSPDLIILDLLMPGLNGYEVLSLLRQRFSIPVIILTAVNEEESIKKTLGIGADDYIIKPFSIPVLLARIRAKLRRTEIAGK